MAGSCAFYGSAPQNVIYIILHITHREDYLAHLGAIQLDMNQQICHNMLDEEVNMDAHRENSAPKDDLKRKRFMKIAERRVNKVLDDLERLGKCSNKRNYEYTDEEVRRVFREIERKLRETRSLFQDGETRRGRFRL